MDRSDYVLLWISKENTSIDNPSMYCSVCRIQYSGSHCPMNSRCTKEQKQTNSFDNKKHIIIATKDYCKAKQYRCNIFCNTCTIKRTYPLIEIL